jgi:hypothetical protein
MATESTASLVEYLRALAPEFFGARMRGASEAEILRLERAAGLRMSDGHREFLRAMGATTARVLNPFLNDHDFCVDKLVAEYEQARRDGLVLPLGVVYFSSSAITGANIFLRHGAAPSDDPEIGDIQPKTGAFVLVDARHFESYLRWHAFSFRMSQLDHELHVRPSWNAEHERWEGNPAACRGLLESQGFERVFAIGTHAECFEHDGVAVFLYHDGSMAMAGDDLAALNERAEAVAAETKLVIERIPRRGRLRAPRE